MKGMVRLVPVCVVALGAACTSFDADKVAAEKRYRTGSSIAERDHTMRDSVQTKEVNTGDPSLGLPMAGKLPRSYGGSQ